MKKQFFIFIVISVLGVQLFAQKRTKSAEIGIFLGGSYYIGDLNPIKHFNEFTKPAGGIVFRYNFNPRLAARANVLLGSIQGDDSYSTSPGQQQRNLNFKSPITEGSVQLEFNFLDYQIGNEKRKFTPYIFFGLGVFQFSPKGEINGNWVALQPLGTEGQGLQGGASKKKYKLIQMSIPFGVGIKANLSKSIGLSIEWGIRKTFTDYLDDVSKRYYDPVQIAAARGTTAAAMSDKSIGNDPNYSNTGRQRGNSTTKDWYSFAGIVLSFKLKQKVPPCLGVGN
ncbi:MAG: type IX secretion system protein PorG [Bacteroidota bacterium]